MANFTGGLGNMQQRGTDRFIVLAGCGAQVNRAGGAFEQDLAQIIFKQANLSTDCPLGDVQFLRSQGKTQMARCRFKRDQAVEWR
ncbi:hypothetical protein D3C76_1602340 [compost metagenome]